MNQKANKKQTFDEGYLDSFIATRIKEIRIARRLTQEQMAEKLNLSSQQAYSSYERGIVKVSATTLYILADALEVAVEDFFPTKANHNLSNDLNNILENLKSHKQRYSNDLTKLESVLKRIDRTN